MPEVTTASTNPSDAIRSTITTYSQGLIPCSHSTTSLPTSTSFSVLLTGSTGNLGSHLLASLLEDPRVTRVYAHNRPSSGGSSLLDRQKHGFTLHGLDHQLLGSEKLVFLEGHLHEPGLGLRSEEYTQLLDDVNVIIHNAWKSNFKLSLSAYEPSIAGSRNLVDLSLASRHPSDLRFMFVSSILAVQNWGKGSAPVPEAHLSDPTTAVGIGYGESKYVVEALLQKSGLKSSTFRVAQLLGDRQTGCWATYEHIPGYIRSSVTLGAFLSSNAMLPWITLLNAARIILDDALSPTFDEGANVYNLEQTHRTPWNTFIAYMNQALVHHGVVRSPLPSLSFNSWTALLREASTTADARTVRNLPTLKLLPILQNLLLSTRDDSDEPRLGNQCVLRTEKLLSRSKTMRGLRAMEAEDAMCWVEHWISIGFLERTASAHKFGELARFGEYRAVL